MKIKGVQISLNYKLYSDQQKLVLNENPNFNIELIYQFKKKEISFLNIHYHKSSLLFFNPQRGWNSYFKRNLIKNYLFKTFPSFNNTNTYIIFQEYLETYKEMCLSDSDCKSFQSCSANACIHQGIANPLPAEIIGYILLPVLLGAINVGGQGGGLTQVPIFVLTLNFLLSEANLMQYLAIFGTSMANAFYLFPQRHPFKDLPLVDYEFTIIVFPAIIFATTLGLYINIMSPDIVLTTMLIIVLAYSTYTTSLKIKQYIDDQKNKKLDSHINDPNVSNRNLISEIDLSPMKGYGDFTPMQTPHPVASNHNHAIFSSQFVDQNKQMVPNVPNVPSSLAAKLNGNQFPQTPRMPALIPNVTVREPNDSSKIDINQNDPDYPAFQKILNSEKRVFPYDKFALMIIIYFLFFLLELIMGNKKLHSIADVELCGSIYWVISFLRLVMIMGFTYLIKRILEQEYRLRRKFNLKAEFQYTGPEFIQMFGLGFFVGIMVGMLGVGGGLFILPFLVGKGYPPQVAAATCAFLYVLISITGLLQLILGKFINDEFMIFYILYCFFGSLIFTGIFTWIQNKYQIGYLGLAFSAFLIFGNLLSNISYMAISYPNQTNDEIFKGGQMCSKGH